MAANYNDNTNFANTNGQGSVNAVRGWLASEASSAISIRGLFLCLGYWYALVLKRMPAGMTPIAATCRTTSDRRHQRHQRWMSGVVVDPGTVGVC